MQFSKRIHLDDIDRVLYHAGCGDWQTSRACVADGFGGAYAFWSKLKQNQSVEYIGCGHYPNEKLITEMCGHNVVMVDICFEKDFMLKLEKVCNRLIVLDHHKTTPEQLPQSLQEYSIVDMTKSGCALAWEYCYGLQALAESEDQYQEWLSGARPKQEPLPLFLAYIQDRDLWAWKLPETKAFTTAFYGSIPFEFEEYHRFRSESEVVKMINKGNTILEYNNKQIENLLRGTYETTFLGYQVAVVESGMYQSELGSSLNARDGIDFAMIWRYNHHDDNIKVCLRSKDHKVDVSEIAKCFGGGGHRNVSGFVWKGNSIKKLLKEEKKKYKWFKLGALCFGMGFLGYLSGRYTNKNK